MILVEEFENLGLPYRVLHPFARKNIIWALWLPKLEGS